MTNLIHFYHMTYFNLIDFYPMTYFTATFYYGITYWCLFWLVGDARVKSLAHHIKVLVELISLLKYILTKLIFH